MSDRNQSSSAHVLKIRSDEPHGWAYTVELDGKPLRCSKVEFKVDAGAYGEAIITLPAAILDLEANVVTQLVQPVVTP
jgi:hypothetical protein